MKKIELLAPAGNYSCLAAAVQNGADAVYFAGKKFGARSYADNFSIDEIKKAIDYCHLRDVKTHIAVNTAYSDKEIEDVLNFVNILYTEGADAIIVSDIGVASVLRENFPDIELHASTQMTIHNLDGAMFAERMGFNRVVLSRELSKNDISYITKNSNIDTEIFAHGALCMSYSGQCLLSSMIGGRSGNRGSCAQPCRLPFSDGTKDKKFLLSLKDLSLAEYINEITECGVSSLKIEGRMKGAAYVATVVSTFRKYIDNGLKISDSDREILDRVFYRGGLTDKYFLGNKGKEMFDFKKPDNPYLKQSVEIQNNFNRNYENENNKKINIDIDFKGNIGEKPYVLIKKDNVSFEYTHNNTLEIAKNNPTTEEMIISQLNKTGGTPYQFNNINIYISENAFLSKGEINEIRRNVLSGFENKYLKSFKRNSLINPILGEFNNENFRSGFSAYISTLEQFNVVKDFDFERIYIPFELALNNIDKFKSLNEKMTVSLPDISFDSEKTHIEKGLNEIYNAGIDKILVNNYGQIQYGDRFNIVLSHRFNIWNREALKVFKKYKFISAFLSPELNNKMIDRMKYTGQSEVIVYGKIPVMITENCIIKNMNKCPCDKDKFYYITDRINVKFPVKSAGKYCRSIMYNSAPIYVADKISENHFDNLIKNLYFTTEDKKECKNICSDYFNCSSDNMPEVYTRGHLYK